MPTLRSIRCVNCPSRRDGLFRRLPTRLYRVLDRAKVSHVLAAGQVLFHEDSPALAVHCLCSGLVKVTKLGREGEEQIIRVLRPPDVAGYRAVLAGEPYGATAQALEPTALCTIPAQVFISLIRESSDFAIDVLAKVARELRISEDSLIELQRKSVLQRLAGTLVALADAQSSVRPVRRALTVRLARRDLARLIGSTPESVSRALHRLVAEKRVRCSRTEIMLLDVPALRAVAGDDFYLGLDGDQSRR
jgi:CRP-like cAMP-binding protein